MVRQEAATVVLYTACSLISMDWLERGSVALFESLLSYRNNLDLKSGRRMHIVKLCRSS